MFLLPFAGTGCQTSDDGIPAVVNETTTRAVVQFATVEFIQRTDFTSQEVRAFAEELKGKLDEVDNTAQLIPSVVSRVVREKLGESGLEPHEMALADSAIALIERRLEQFMENKGVDRLPKSVVENYADYVINGTEFADLGVKPPEKYWEQ